ncbi:MAG: substrate-binding domain-containing protein [Planctomycetaceae bacterium]|nr:substrate-binding domain-containing protein [Planctomycetaceae bacterium]
MKHPKRFLYLGIVLLICGAAAFFVRQQIFPPKMSPSEYLLKHNIQTLEGLTEKHFEFLLSGVPKKHRKGMVEKLTDIDKMSPAMKQGINELYGIVYCYKDYPPVYDPGRKSEYIEKSVAEWYQYTDDRIEKFKNWREKDPKTRESESLVRSLYLFQLSEQQKERLRNGKPMFDNPYIGFLANISSASWESALWGHSDPVQAYMFERRNEELAPLKVDATPNLVQLNLTIGDIERWDGSTSLQPVARIIAARAAEIPWKWRPPGSFHQRDGSEIVLTDHYLWAVDDEVAIVPEENYNRLYTRFPSYHPNALSASPLPKYAPGFRPTSEFLNYFKFNQTHGAFVNVIEGHRDLMFATRRPSPDELKLAKEKNVELECTPFARDAFVFIVNRHNPVRNLTLQQVRDIFAGKITKWKRAGGFAGTVHPLIRDRNSGSEELMRELVMKNVLVPANFRHQLISGMSGLFDVLEKDMEGIGYTILYYDRYMVCNPHTRTLLIDGIEPSPQTVADGTYPLLYECVAVTRKGGPKRAQDIVDYLVSEEGQAVIRETGYCPWLGGK